MSWVLLDGSGKQAFAKEMAAAYAEASANQVKVGGESINGPSNWVIIKDRLIIRCPQQERALRDSLSVSRYQITCAPPIRFEGENCQNPTAKSQARRHDGVRLDARTRGQ